MTAMPESDAVRAAPGGPSRAVAPTAEIVITTVGRPSLATLLRALAAQEPPWTGRVTVVDDRVDARAPLPGLPHGGLDVVIVRSGARGPAAARNVGLAAGRAPWVVFLDDTVVPAPGWVAGLHSDLASARDTTAAVRGRVVDPRGARPVAAGPREVEHASDTATDLAVRRDALARLGGFDERIPHAHRGEADVTLRLRRTGAGVEFGARTVLGPEPAATRWASVTRQRGHRDDARMRWEHGRHWRRDAAIGRGRIRRHLGATTAGLAAAAGVATGHRRIGVLAGAIWLALTAELTWARATGARSPRALAPVAVTSAAIPPVAVYHRIRGELAVRKLPTP